MVLSLREPSRRQLLLKTHAVENAPSLYIDLDLRMGGVALRAAAQDWSSRREGRSAVPSLRMSWGVAPNTAIKYTEIAKSFFNYAVANKWIVKSSAKLIKGARGKAASNQRARIPFSDEELQRMYDACEHQYGQTP